MLECQNITIKNIQHTMIWDKKSTSFINNSMIIPSKPKLTTAPRTWSGLLFTKIQVHICMASPLNLLLRK